MAQHQTPGGDPGQGEVLQGGLDCAMDIVEQVEAEQAAGRSSTSTEVSEVSSNASPPRLFSHAGTLEKEEAPSRQDASTPDSRGRSPRGPLAPLGP